MQAPLLDLNDNHASDDLGGYGPVEKATCWRKILLGQPHLPLEPFSPSLVICEANISSC